MNKAELVKDVAAKANITNKQSEVVVNALIASIADALKNGEKVSILGFGTFDTKKREAREAINPRTMEKIQVPASVTPTFKAGKAFKDSLN